VARNRILEKHLRGVPAKRVLDVGCGRGILLDYLIARGIDTYGVELSAVTVTSRLEGRLYAGIQAESLPAAFRDSVDTLVLGDVIEHLPDAPGYLNRLVAAFKRTENIVITVPARQEVWSNYDEHYGHYRRYDLATLRATVSAIGFTPIKLGYLFRFLYPPALLLRCLGRRRPTSLAAPRFPSLHRSVAAAMVAEYILLPRWIPGTSAICVAVRPAPKRAS
jgi:SAM-dependent methyltransferase